MASFRCFLLRISTMRATSMEVPDRWHLTENASSAFLDAACKSTPAICGAIGATTISPALLTNAEKLQCESYLRREETNAATSRRLCERAHTFPVWRQIGDDAICRCGDEACRAWVVVVPSRPGPPVVRGRRWDLLGAPAPVWLRGGGAPSLLPRR